MPSPKINRAPNLGIISETSPEISNNLTSLASFEICKITQIFPKVKVLITKLVQLKKVVLKNILRREMKLLFHKYLYACI